MAILAECPNCRAKQSNRNKMCKCGCDLDKAKRSGRVRYWINYRLPGKKQRREPVGFSIKKARDAEGKRRAQKREGRIFDMLPESRMTFAELAEWYMGRAPVKRLASFIRIEYCFSAFNTVFGDWIVSEIRRVDLENYQQRGLDAGKAPATIDMEIKYAAKAVSDAFDNDMVDGRALKPFRSIRKLMKVGSNTRDRLVTISQYRALLDKAADHYCPVLVIAMNTGMRMGEIRALRWSYIDREAKMLRLPASDVKEGRSKSIPINHHVEKAIGELPRALHHDHIITYRGTPMNGPNSLKKQFPETCKRAGVPYGRKTPGGITFHDIRRTVKTGMLQAGVDKAYRDAIFGHRSTDMDAHYLIATDEALTAAMEKYTRWLDQELESVDQSVDQKSEAKK